MEPGQKGPLGGSHAAPVQPAPPQATQFFHPSVVAHVQPPPIATQVMTPPQEPAPVANLFDPSSAPPPPPVTEPWHAFHRASTPAATPPPSQPAMPIAAQPATPTPTPSQPAMPAVAQPMIATPSQPGMQAVVMAPPGMPQPVMVAVDAQGQPIPGGVVPPGYAQMVLPAGYVLANVYPPGYGPPNPQAVAYAQPQGVVYQPGYAPPPPPLSNAAPPPSGPSYPGYANTPGPSYGSPSTGPAPSGWPPSAPSSAQPPVQTFQGSGQGASAASGWGGLVGAAAMMPPDEDEELAVAGQLARKPASAAQPSSSAFASSSSSGSSSASAVAPASQAAPAATTAEDEEGPPLPRPDLLPDIDLAMGVPPDLAAPKSRAPRPSAPRSSSVSAPMAPVSMDSIPLVTDVPITAPPPDASERSGEFCRRCGTRVFQSMLRCPSCKEPVPSARRTGPRATAPRAKPRGIGKLVVALVVTALLVGGGIVSYFTWFAPRDDGAPTAEEAVTGFLHSVVDGQLLAGAKLVHPAQRGAAETTIEGLQKQRGAVAQIAARIFRMSGVGRVGWRIEKSVFEGEERSRVEVTLERDGLPVRRTRLVVRREANRWYLDGNPFTGLP